MKPISELMKSVPLELRVKRGIEREREGFFLLFLKTQSLVEL